MGDETTIIVDQEFDENISECKKSQNTDNLHPFCKSTLVKDVMDKCFEVAIINMPSTSECDSQQGLPAQSNTLGSNPVITETLCTDQKNDTNLTSNRRPKMMELDKFKRRMIRAIARLMYVEKKPEADIWEELKKETSCDCKLLWTRMRALTIKKLNRLFDANDRTENITKIAQLSVTDWLLFDLTLVHEEVGVIGQEVQVNKSKTEQNILEDLFLLVAKYEIESSSGDRLTSAWFDLTEEYNSRGRKCSPMLLQRRWYQMKHRVRSKFYKFWFEYRGSEKNLNRAEKYKPTKLEVEIVKAYMYIVTQPLKTWQQLIAEKKVSLLSDFERIQLSKQKSSEINENEPDVVVIEPHVETIDLGLESGEDSRDSSDSIKINTNVSEDPNTASNNKNDSQTIIKTESIYDICDEDDVNTLESTYIPLESIGNLAINECNKEMGSSNMEITNDLSKFDEERPMVSATTNVTQNNFDEEVSHKCVEDEVDLVVESGDIVHTQYVQDNDFEMVMPKITSITSTAQIPSVNQVHYETPNEINNILEKISDKISQSFNVTTPNTNNEQIVINTETLAKSSKDKIDITINTKPTKEQCNNLDSMDINLMTDFTLEDDGIEYIDEEDYMEEPNEDIKLEVANSKMDDDDDTPKIDLKLLLDPVVYTKKLDHMDVFRFIDYVTVKDRRVIENAAIESKPVDKNSVKMDTISEDCLNDIQENIKVDEEASECSTENEYETIKSTSWLLRKPKAITYNPIQLCKNPDFNTRLKRLSAGFFSSQRNRELLKSCKPLTIDVSKTFETKLVNNSLYLEKSLFVEAKKSEIIKTVEKTILPSEPGSSEDQRLNVQPSTPIPTTSNLNELPTEFTREVCTIERNNKVINLPDLDQIRRKNEKLLIAEVTPLQAVNVTSKPPVLIVPNDKMTEQNFQHVNKIENHDIAKELSNVNASTTIVLPNLKNNDITKNNATIENTGMLCSDNISDLNIEELITETYGRKRKCSYKLNKTTKVRKVSVTWNSRNGTTIDAYNPDDRLLAPDTVERIINVCQGITYSLSKKQNVAITKKRKVRKSNAKGHLVKQKKIVRDNSNLSRKNTELENKYNSINVVEKQQQQPEIIVLNETETVFNETVVQDVTIPVVTIPEETIPEVVIPEVTIPEVPPIPNNITKTNNCDSRTEVNDEGKKNKVVRRRKSKHCCWAREKLLFWDNKIERVRRHLCPRFKCNCCCSQVYCDQLRLRRQNKLSKVSFCNLVSDDESDHNTEISRKTTETVSKQLIKISNKVNIGINTDFDKDFEESYAANINDSKIRMNSIPVNQPIITCLNPLYDKESNSLSTQTYTYTKNKPNSALECNVESDGITDKPALPSEVNNDSTLNNGKPKFNAPKCKTNIRKGTNYIPIAPKVSDTNADTLPTNNTKIITVQKKSLRKPIYLGRNKILLCSLQPLSKTGMIDVTHLVDNIKSQMNNHGINSQSSTLIPDGVHLVLLPNQELVLSIDPGVELGPTQITYLPTILNLVQQQLYSLGVINKQPLTNTHETGDIIQLSDDETENINANSSSLKYSNDDSSSNAAPTETLSGAPINERVNNDDNMPKIDHKISETGNDDSSSNAPPIEIVSDASVNEFVNNNENIQKISETGNDVTEEVIQKQTSSSDLNVIAENDIVLESSKSDDVKDTANIAKKTIISDLMEMSGISLEDTATSIENPIKQTKLSQPIVQETSNEHNILINTEVEVNTIQNNPFVQAALTKCPELYIIYSFEDLKYAYENNGQFYKMNIEDGIIVPIEVSIRKTNSKKKNTLLPPKEIIDLTEEDNPERQTAESISEENNDECFIENGISIGGVKPIKLFKSVHPSILRHNFKTLSMRQNSKYDPHLLKKRVIKLIKHKRKEMAQGTDLSSKVSDDNVEENINMDSESDDEPLAVKAKRIHRPSVGLSENEETSPNINSQPEEFYPLYQQEVNCDEASSHKPMVVENEEGVFDSSHLPIMFQCNNDDTSDEDCILGV